MRKVSAGCFSVIFLFLYQCDSATLKWKTANDTLYLNEPEIIKDYKIPQATIKLIKPKGFSISIPGDKRLKRVIFDILITKRPKPYEFYEILEEMENCDIPELIVQNHTIALGRNYIFGYIIDMYLKDNTRRRIRFDHTVNERQNGELFIVTPPTFKTYAPYRPRKKTTVSANISSPCGNNTLKTSPIQ